MGNGDTFVGICVVSGLGGRWAGVWGRGWDDTAGVPGLFDSL